LTSAATAQRRTRRGGRGGLAGEGRAAATAESKEATAGASAAIARRLPHVAHCSVSTSAYFWNKLEMAADIDHGERCD
jgi:hypothetical protein